MIYFLLWLISGLVSTSFVIFYLCMRYDNNNFTEMLKEFKGYFSKDPVYFLVPIFLIIGGPLTILGFLMLVFDNQLLLDCIVQDIKLIYNKFRTWITND